MLWLGNKLWFSATDSFVRPIRYISPPAVPCTGGGVAAGSSQLCQHQGTRNERREDPQLLGCTMRTNAGLKLDRTWVCCAQLPSELDIWRVRLTTSFVDWTPWTGPCSCCSYHTARPARN
jgi:hypothetical protein